MQAAPEEQARLPHALDPAVTPLRSCCDARHLHAHQHDSDAAGHRIRNVWDLKAT
jgi:hypothetical protein